MVNINDKLLNGYSNWTPSNSYLAMSTMALNQFWYKCNQSSVLDSISKGFTQPLNYINFIKVYPFNVMGRTYEETNVPVHIANQFINVPNNRTDAILKDSHVGNINPRIHETYTFNFDAKTKFTDYEPYTTCECFLPYVGFITLAPSELVGVIQVDLIIDVISGNGTYCISRGGHVIYTVQTNFSVDIPLGGTNNIEQFKAQFNNGVSALMGIGMTALGIGTGNTFLTSQGIGSSVNAITNIPNSNTSHMIKRGTLGNYSTNFNNPHSIYFIFKKRNINDYDGFIETYGKPLNKKVKLSDITGMTFVPNPKLEIKGITSEEYDILRGLLKNGVIIGKGLNVSDIRLRGSYYRYNVRVSNVKLKGAYDELKVKVDNVKLNGKYNLLGKLLVTNVKLKGIYDEFKVKVNNIKLKGTYNLLDKLTVTNVKLNGTYKLSKVNVKNVSLKGTYNLLDKLTVTNVKLNGLYNEFKVKVNNVALNGTYLLQPKIEVSNVSLLGTYDLYKIKVSNVILNGNYKILPKLEVSNVSLSGSYNEYKIKVSNVALSGIYNAMHKLEVSNVALSGSYLQEISNYTLTINFYKDSSLYNTITQEYASGTTISPTSIATKYIPTDYEVDKTTPTSDFDITEDTTVSVYYKAKSGEITDLTGYIWTGNSSLSVINKPSLDYYGIFYFTLVTDVGGSKLYRYLSFIKIDNYLNYLKTKGYISDYTITKGSKGWLLLGLTSLQLNIPTEYIYASEDLSGTVTIQGNTTSCNFTSGYSSLGKTMYFDSGTDATNTDLIAWLQENGTFTKN